MCAIAGVVCAKPGCDGRHHLPAVRSMCDLQSHRGPDDQDVRPLGPVCLGSNRLSILDLSRAGRMPMSDPSGRWWIVYNGETYNFQELREELRGLGHAFTSGSDTEVVLHAFQEWGDACLERMVGMFAFAVLDREARTVTLARDRFGKKPLYYMQQDGHLFFASEVKALLRVRDEVRPNYRRLLEWTLYRNAELGAPDTFVDGICALPPGHVMRVGQGRLEPPRAYYTPAAQVDRDRYARLQEAPVDAVLDEIDRLLNESVRARLVSDVPLGTLCSGGIDSSLITALCARHIPDVAAFHVSVAGYPALDERAYAKQVTDGLGLTLHTYELTADAFRRHLPRAIYHSDFPLTHPNSVAFLLISEFARSRGVTILLSGEAADELFGGYIQRYRHLRQFLRAQRLLARAPARIRKVMAWLGYAAERVPITAFSEYPALLAHTTSMLDLFARDDLRIRCEEAYGFIANEDDRAVLGAMLGDVTNFLSPLLRRLDRMSMAASVECRTPFLDHRLVQLAVNLPLQYRLHGRTDKWVLKQVAARYLPHDVVFRKKVGFPLPVSDYLAPLAREEFFADGFCVEALGIHRRGLLEAVRTWPTNVNGFFNLLALEIWGRLFVLGQSVEEVSEKLQPLPGKAA
jgi:asparagine synthase (glutamine-hydrolysing)